MNMHILAGLVLFQLVSGSLAWGSDECAKRFLPQSFTARMEASTNLRIGGILRENVDALKARLESDHEIIGKFLAHDLPTSDEFKQAVASVFLQDAADFLFVTGTKFALSQSLAPYPGLALQVMPADDARLAKMARVLERRGGWTLIFDAHDLIARRAGGLVGDKSFRTSAYTLTRPSFKNADVFHEWVHISYDGLVGAMWAAGDMPTLFPTPRDNLTRFQRDDEPEAYLASIYRMLKIIGKHLAHSAEHLPESLDALNHFIDVGLAAAGRLLLVSGAAISNIGNDRSKVTVLNECWVSLAFTLAEGVPVQWKIPLSAANARGEICPPSAIVEVLRWRMRQSEQQIAILKDLKASVVRMRQIGDPERLESIRSKMVLAVIRSKIHFSPLRESVRE